MARTPFRRLLSPLAARDFRLLWAGQTVSLVGNGIFMVAITWEALRVGGGARALAAVLLAYVVPTTAFLLLGGVVSDRLPRRATMMACDVAQAVVVGALAVVALRGDVAVWHLVVVAGAAGVAAGFFLPASTGFVPEVTPRESLVAANSLIALSRLSSARLVGPAIGGFLVAASGAGLAFAIDALTFLVSAACLAAIRHRRAPAEDGEDAPGARGGGLRAELAEGLAYCRRRRWLWVSLLAFAVLNVGVSAPLAALLPVYVKEHLGLDARALGLLFAAEGASAAVATVLAGNLPAPRLPVVATHLTFGASGLALAVMALPAHVAVAAAALFLVAFLLELGNVYWASGLQAAVPARLLGRVSSVDWLVSGSLLPLGIAIVGPAAAAFGVAPVFGAGGLLTAVAAGGALAAIGAADPASRAADGAADHGA